MFLAWCFHFFSFCRPPSIILPLFLALSLSFTPPVFLPLYYLCHLSLFLSPFLCPLHLLFMSMACLCERVWASKKERETGCRAYPCMLSKLEWTRAPISWLCQTPASPVTQGHLIFCLILRQSVCIFGWLCAGKLTINNKCGLKGCSWVPNTPPLKPTIQLLSLPRLSARVMKMSVVLL